MLTDDARVDSLTKVDPNTGHSTESDKSQPDGEHRYGNGGTTASLSDPVGRRGAMNVLRLMLGFNVIALILVVGDVLVRVGNSLSQSHALEGPVRISGNWPSVVLMLGGALGLVAYIAFAVLLLLGPVSLALKQVSRGRRGSAVAAAIIEILFFPIGTILGIVLLMRLFGRSARMP